jgi:hypothetical protein
MVLDNAVRSGAIAVYPETIPQHFQAFVEQHVPAQQPEGALHD